MYRSAPLSCLLPVVREPGLSALGEIRLDALNGDTALFLHEVEAAVHGAHAGGHVRAAASVVERLSVLH